MGQSGTKLFAALAVIALSLFSARQHAAAQTKTSDEFAAVLGEWRGESICLARKPICKDEKVIYRIRRSAEDPSRISVIADKIVDEHPVYMGTLACDYEKIKQVLSCEMPQGVWKFTVAGMKMQGTLTLNDKTLARRVSVEK